MAYCGVVLYARDHDGFVCAQTDLNQGEAVEGE